ncbi:MAG: MATE family efflux transporter [Gammaproteobacteria bacterium]|nr:MATE family efflux transporter [Gammaproteobacteria bacterium]
MERVEFGLKVAYQFCLVWGLFATIVTVVFGDVIASWVDGNVEVVATAAFYLAVVPWSYGLWGVLMMSSASFNALGKPIPSTVLSFTRMFLVYVPLALLLDYHFGYFGILIATAVSNAVMGLFGFLWLQQRFFQRLQ